MALEVGSVVARFETRFESAGVDRFESRITAAEVKAKEVGRSVSTAGGGFRRLGEDAAVAGRELENVGARATRGAGGLRRAGAEADTTGKRMKEGAGHVRGLALSFLGFGGAIGLEEAIRKSNERLGELQVTSKQTEAVLKSTGGQAHVTAKEIDALALAIGRKTGIDHEQIVQGENMLLTFRDVRNEVGKGNDIFTQSTKAAVDMSAAFTAAGKSMSIGDAALQLGKAINDPVKGMTRLQRIGVTFTDQQKAQVAALEASGHKLEAQKVILGELTKEFGGSADAAGRTMPAALNKAKIAAEDLGASLLKKLAPNIEHGASKAAKFIGQMQDGTGAGGRFAKKVSDVAHVVGQVGGGFVHAAEDVAGFFSHHKDLLKVAATMAGIAGSVKVIQKLGSITGLTSLLKLAAGGARGGILGTVTKAEPLPVYVVNKGFGGPGGGGGNGLIKDAERGAEDVGAGAVGADVAGGTAVGAGLAVTGGAVAAGGIIALGKMAETIYRPWSEKVQREFGAAVGMAPSMRVPGSTDNSGPVPTYHSVIQTPTGVHGVSATGVRPGILDQYDASLHRGGSAPQSGGVLSRFDAAGKAPTPSDLTAIDRAGTAWGKVSDKAGQAKSAVAQWRDALRALSPAPLSAIQKGAEEAVKAMSGATLTTKDLDTVIKAASRGAFGPASNAIADTADHVEHLRDRLSHLKSGSDEYKSTAGQLQRAQDRLNSELVAAYRAGKRGAAGIVSIGVGASSASDAVGSAASTIAHNVDSLARQLGAQGVSFTPAKTPAGQAAQAGAFGGLGDLSSLGAQGGAHIVGGRPGARGRDDRLLLGADGRPEAVVGAGELLVANGDQQTALDRILHAVGLGGLGGFFSRPWRDHAQTPGYAGGGLVPDVSILGPGGGYSRDANAATRMMDRAAEAKIRKLANAPLNRMIRFGKGIAARHWPYVYGGGHGSFNGPYDCSGFVSAILHAGGLMPGGPMTTDGLKNYGEAGDGKRITIGVRGSTGRNAHTMIQVGGHYFESGGGHGAAEDSGWDGNFPIHRHPKGFARGGLVSVDELPEHVRELVTRYPELLDPRHPAFVGFGLARGGRLSRLLDRIPRYTKGKTPKPKTPKPSVSAAKKDAAAAHAHAVKVKPGTMAATDKRITAATDSYGRLERRQGLTTETLIVTDDDGTQHIDKAAQKRGQTEVNARINAKKAIQRKLEGAITQTSKSLGQARKARDDIAKALQRIPTSFPNTKAGKKAKAAADKLRSTYKQRLQGYSTSLGDLKDRLSSLRGQRADLGLDLKELGVEKSGYSDSALQAQIPPAPAPTLDSSMTQAEHDTLGQLDYDAAQATLTPDDQTDDEAVRARTQTFWQGVVDRLKASGASTAVLTEATTALAGTLASGSSSGSSSTPTADQTAINSQLQTNLATAKREAAINAAAVAAFGSSGDVGAGAANAYAAARDEGGWTTRSGATPAAAPAIVQNNYMLHPADPAVLKTVGQATVAGLSYQGTPGSPRQPATL